MSFVKICSLRRRDTWKVCLFACIRVCVCVHECLCVYVKREEEHEHSVCLFNQALRACLRGSVCICVCACVLCWVCWVVCRGVGIPCPLLFHVHQPMFLRLREWTLHTEFLSRNISNAWTGMLSKGGGGLGWEMKEYGIEEVGRGSDRSEGSMERLRWRGEKLKPKSEQHEMRGSAGRPKMFKIQ